MYICDLQECEKKQAEKLETVLASLSDAQFTAFVKILASSPRARHRMYLSICALEDMQKIDAQYAWNLPVPSPFAFPTYPISVHEPEPKPDGIVHQPDGRHCLYISFSIDDVDGARDLLVRIAHKMSQIGLDPYASNILLLQQFASLSRTVSTQLLRKWALKYKSLQSWNGIDEVTLDLRRAYAPDGVYLPTAKWLQEVNESRDATPTVFTIITPTKISKKVRDPFNPAILPHISTSYH